MKQLLKFPLVVAMAMCGMPGAAQDALFSANSKARGAPFEISISETQREATKSVLSVPGFHARSAPASRWLMCGFTELAIQRGFEFWSVMYPAEGSELLILGLSNSSKALPKDLMGDDYVAERVLGNGMVPVEKFVKFCGLRRE